MSLLRKASTLSVGYSKNPIHGLAPSLRKYFKGSVLVLNEDVLVLIVAHQVMVSSLLSACVQHSDFDSISRLGLGAFCTGSVQIGRTFEISSFCSYLRELRANRVTKIFRTFREALGDSSWQSETLPRDHDEMQGPQSSRAALLYVRNCRITIFISEINPCNRNLGTFAQSPAMDQQPSSSTHIWAKVGFESLKHCFEA